MFSMYKQSLSTTSVFPGFLRFCHGVFIVAAIGFASFFTPGIFAQESIDVIKIDTDLVAFEVSISDKDGNPVKGLKSEDFKLYVDGEQRSIDFFRPIRKNDENRPLSIVFALDVSGSITKDELRRLRAAMQTFVNKLADYNSHFAVVTFGMRVKILQSFTNRPDKLYKTFDKILKEQDGLSTHAYDAIDDAIRMIEKKSPKSVGQRLPKRVIVVITDGYPVGDTVSPDTVIDRANNAETSIYALILPSYSILSVGKKPVLTLLEASGVTERTGGRSFYAIEQDFEPLFKALAEEITASYSVAFYPEEQPIAEKKFYKVRIETTRDLLVKQNRDGYQIKRPQ